MVYVTVVMVSGCIGIGDWLGWVALKVMYWNLVNIEIGFVVDVGAFECITVGGLDV